VFLPVPTVASGSPVADFGLNIQTFFIRRPRVAEALAEAQALAKVDAKH